MQHKQIAIFRSVLTALFASAAASSMLSALAPAFGKTEAPSSIGYSISQSTTFLGFITSDIAPGAIRMKLDKLRLTVIAKAPDWKAYIYNDDTHKYCEMPLEQWTKRFNLGKPASFTGPHGESLLAAKSTGKTAQIAGLKVTEFDVYKKPDPRLHETNERLRMVLWMAPEIVTPPQIAQLFSLLLHAPLQKGIPLRAMHDNNGRMVSDIDTLDVKHGPIASACFEPKRGYTRVKDEMQLIMDESSDDMLGGVLDDPSIETHPEKHQF